MAPSGSKVERLYKHLRQQGKSKQSAARIAQSQTGQSLRTGRASKRAKRH